MFGTLILKVLIFRYLKFRLVVFNFTSFHTSSGIQMPYRAKMFSVGIGDRDNSRDGFCILIFSVLTTATGGLCRHAASVSLSYENTIPRTRRVNEYPGEK